MFPARLSELHALRGFIDEFCAQTALGRQSCLRLHLVLEELFTNTVRHGHRGDSEAPVWVSLAAGDGARVAVSYEDTAPPFNPYARSSPDTTQQIRTPGGRGVVLLQRLSADPDYAYLFGRNCIRLALD
jgi:anti-sigma regulatory factor (Ser/Thr protein kinase)